MRAQSRSNNRMAPAGPHVSAALGPVELIFATPIYVVSFKVVRILLVSLLSADV